MQSKKAKLKRVYMDYASATPIDSRIKAAMRKIEDSVSGNPDALHKEGREASRLLENARKIVATILRARSLELFFTSGATESNNLALLGVYNAALPAFQKLGKKPHIITSTIEHKSILEVAKHLEKLGANVSYIRPNGMGIINPKDVRDCLKPETILVSIMYANNEIGTINDIEAIAKEVRHARRLSPMAISGSPYFHTDATQAVNYLNINILKLNVDLLTINSPKIYGPSGIGALYIKKGTPIDPIIFGGGQENGMRAGRELPLLAFGFAKALEIAEGEKDKESARLIKLRDYFFKKILEIAPNASINGDMENRLPNNINICIPNLDAEFAVYQLDERGIACSSASTCVNNSLDSYSYVVKEIKPKTDGINCSASSLRFSLGRFTNKAEIDYCLKALAEVVSRQYSVRKP